MSARRHKCEVLTLNLLLLLLLLLEVELVLVVLLLLELLLLNLLLLMLMLKLLLLLLLCLRLRLLMGLLLSLRVLVLLWHHVLSLLLLSDDVVLNEPLGVGILAEVHTPLVKEAVEGWRGRLDSAHGSSRHLLWRTHLLLHLELDSRLEIVVGSHVHGRNLLLVRHSQGVGRHVLLLLVIGKDEHVKFIRGKAVVEQVFIRRERQVRSRAVGCGGGREGWVREAGRARGERWGQVGVAAKLVEAGKGERGWEESGSR